MTESNLLDIKFFILGVKGLFRGEHLFTSLKDCGADVEIVFGFDGSKRLPLNIKEESVKSQFYYGRSLSGGEHACTLGHTLMLRKGLSSKCSLAVFLEDDVLISNMKLFLDLIISLNWEQSSLFSLYSNPGSILSLNTSKSKGAAHRNYCIPTGTVAYAMTKPAMQSIIKNEIKRGFKSFGFQADYPLYYADTISFFYVPNNFVKLSNSDSLIGARGKPANLKSSRLLRILSIYSLASYFTFGKQFSSLKAYVMFFHGRKLALIISSFKNVAFIKD